MKTNDREGKEYKSGAKRNREESDDNGTGRATWSSQSMADMRGPRIDDWEEDSFL